MLEKPDIRPLHIPAGRHDLTAEPASAGPVTKLCAFNPIICAGGGNFSTQHTCSWWPCWRARSSWWVVMDKARSTDCCWSSPSMPEKLGCHTTFCSGCRDTAV